jgi:hypothetical protein
VGTAMSMNFWSFEPPKNQRRATEGPNTKYEKVICPVDDRHTRAGRGLGGLSVTIDPTNIKDITWTWSTDVLVTQRVLDVFDKHRVTGFETRPAEFKSPKRSGPELPPMFELIVTGWGGMGAAASGVRVSTLCSTCKYQSYFIADPSHLIDPASWDSSDLFIVWPLPRYRFASDRLAGIIRQEKITGVRLIPASDIPMKKDSTVYPGRLANSIPEERARELREPFGIF